MRWLLTAVLFLCIAAGVSATEDPRFALVIGNSAYDGDAALANPANDATDISASLTSIGWKVTKVIDADRKTMNRAISDLRNAMAGTTAPTALLYYAGHGVQINGTNYLIPVRESFESSDDVRNEAISLETVLSMFSEAGVTTQLVILDACRDNPFEKKSTRSLGSASRGLSVVTKSSDAAGSVVMFATAPGQTAADGKGRNGIFTQALLKYLKTDLKLQDMVTRVAAEVKTLTNGQQTPYNSISLYDDFYMVPASLRTTTSTTSPMAIVTAPTMIPFVVNDVPDGLEVWVNGKQVGTTPYSTTVDSRIPFVVELKGEDYEPYKETVDPAGQERVYVSPTMARTAAFVVRGLNSDRAGLVIQLNKLRSTGGFSALASGLGILTTLGGGGLAGYSWYLADGAVKDYNAATSQQQLNAARNSANSANQLFNIGLGAAGGGVITWLLGTLMAPDTRSLEEQIAEIDREISVWKRS